MKRRSTIMLGVALVTGAAGLAGAILRSRQAPADPANPGASAPPAAQADVWSQRFQQPGGAELVLANFKGQPLLLNFWATWCPPCVTEMPLLDRFQTQQRSRGWQVVGLAVDDMARVQEFLARTPMGFQIAVVGADGIQLARDLGNLTGGMPFSVVFDRHAKLVRTKLGSLTEQELTEWAKSVG